MSTPALSRAAIFAAQTGAAASQRADFHFGIRIEWPRSVAARQIQNQPLKRDRNRVGVAGGRTRERPARVGHERFVDLKEVFAY